MQMLLGSYASHGSQTINMSLFEALVLACWVFIHDADFFQICFPKKKLSEYFQSVKQSQSKSN